MDGPVDEVSSAYLTSVAAHDDGRIEHRADRSGSGLVRFTHVEITDAHGHPTRILRAGGEATIALTYTSTVERLGRCMYGSI